MQVRINCEDPRNNFEPNAGLITRHAPPGGTGVRINTSINTGYQFPSQYDLAATLLIAYGRSWNKCVKVSEATGIGTQSIEMADACNLCHIAAPSNGDLWVMYANEGDAIHKGQELFNISIMKQEKAVCAPIDGIVKRVLKTANYQETQKMIPVVNGELLVEVSPVLNTCTNCKSPIDIEHQKFCPICGNKICDCIGKN